MPGPGAWLTASRPATLWAAVAPVVVGTACAVAVGGFRPVPAAVALAGALCIQIGTNFANDVFDYEKGADTTERLGPTRAVQAGLLTSRQMWVGTWVAFGLATLAGLYLTWVAGPVVVVVGVASILSGLAYTGGPYPLGYHGLGDLFVLVFFGFVAVCTTALVQVGSVPEVAWWAAVPVGALATAVLAVNNLRDRDTDARAGKKTLAVRFGRRFVRAEFVVLFLVAYAIPALMILRRLSAGWVALPWLSLPFAGALVWQVYRRRGKSLNRTLAGTARLLLVFSLLFAAGIVLGRGSGMGS